MLETLFEKVRRWARDPTKVGDHFLNVWDQIEYLANKRFHEYHPTVGPYPDFRTRLKYWINNTSDEAYQKILFELVPRIFFVGSFEFNALYRAAFNGPILRWLVEVLNVQLSPSTLNNDISKAIGETWFCPITDSMQIAAFHHVNNIEGKDYRPDWRSLQRFGSPERIRDYMNNEGLQRLVLIEDFVGSGSQIERTLDFVASALPSPSQILVAPLIICPRGNNAFVRIAARYNNLSFKPVLILNESEFVVEVPRSGHDEDDFIRSVRRLIVDAYSLVSGGEASDDGKKPYGPFGYARTGAMLVMYTNCPDNSLPIIHNRSQTWSPLFPRSSRI